jgi:hypothetical protein
VYERESEREEDNSYNRDKNKKTGGASLGHSRYESRVARHHLRPPNFNLLRSSLTNLQQNLSKDRN